MIESDICKEIENRLRKLDSVASTVNQYYDLLTRKLVMGEELNERQQAIYDLVSILHDYLV